MGIYNIKVENFKSFKKLDLNLGKFHILIGANASGKSNFIHIFEFLRDIEKDGLNDAISLQGGIEYFRNIKVSSSKNFSVEVKSNQPIETGMKIKKDYLMMRTKDISYMFALEFYKRKIGFNIVKDHLHVDFDIRRMEKQRKGIVQKEKLGVGHLTVFRKNNKIDLAYNIPKNIGIKIEEILPMALAKSKWFTRNIILETPFFFLPFGLTGIFRGISLFNINPELAKRCAPIGRKRALEEHGGNLAIVLKNILEDKGKERRFYNLIKDVLSFIQKFDVERFVDKSLLIKLKEIYHAKKFLPASLISDGTINTIALIIALYFERRSSLVIIEEPERNIHPYLISKITDMMREVSSKKQIIVTTHNPEMVRHAKLEDILLVARDKEGFSKVSHAKDNRQVRQFLKHRMGIEDLFVQNLLQT